MDKYLRKQNPFVNLFCWSLGWISFKKPEFLMYMQICIQGLARENDKAICENG